MTDTTNDGATAPADDAALFAAATGALTPETPQPAEVTPPPEVPAQVKPPEENVGMRELREAHERSQRRERDLERQLADAHRRAPEEKKAAPDIFENPNEAINSMVDPRFQTVEEKFLALAKENAEIKFTSEKVAEAEKAFIQAVQARTLDPADYNRVVNSPNRYRAAVEWHQRQAVLAEVGSDPAAYKAKLRAELLKDPEFLKEAQGSARTIATQTGNTVARPAVSSIPSLTRVGAASLPDGQEERSDAELFASATRRNKRASG